MATRDESQGDLVVLAGGRSRRFGDGDKALVDLAGKPLVRHGADRCVAVTDRTVVNCRPDQHDALAAAFEGHGNPVRFAVDSETDRGPLAGMVEGLEQAEAEYVVVLACDVPFVPPGLVLTLFDRAQDRDGAVPQVEGRVQPTCAVYRVEPALATGRRLLDGGERRARALVDALSVRVVEAESASGKAGTEWFCNVNTQEDLARAERRLLVESG